MTVNVILAVFHPRGGKASRQYKWDGTKHSSATATDEITRADWTAQKYQMEDKTNNGPSQSQRNKEKNNEEYFLQGKATGTTKKERKSRGRRAVQLIASE